MTITLFFHFVHIYRLFLCYNECVKHRYGLVKHIFVWLCCLREDATVPGVAAAGVFTLWHDMKRKPEAVILRFDQTDLTVI